MAAETQQNPGPAGFHSGTELWVADLLQSTVGDGKRFYVQIELAGLGPLLCEPCKSVEAVVHLVPISSRELNKSLQFTSKIEATIGIRSKGSQTLNPRAWGFGFRVWGLGFRDLYGLCKGFAVCNGKKHRPSTEQLTYLSVYRFTPALGLKTMLFA